jgi:hypothetical protein
MSPSVVSLGVVLLLTPLAHAQPPGRIEKPARFAIMILAPNSWILDIRTDGSGALQYGALAGDNWQFKAGTFDAKKVTRDLKALGSDKPGRSGSHFVFSFESERKGPAQPGPSWYTRDQKVIPALLKRAIEAADNHSPDRRAQLLKEYPPELPKQK